MIVWVLLGLGSAKGWRCWKKREMRDSSSVFVDQSLPPHPLLPQSPTSYTSPPQLPATWGRPCTCPGLTQDRWQRRRRQISVLMIPVLVFLSDLRLCTLLQQSGAHLHGLVLTTPSAPATGRVSRSQRQQSSNMPSELRRRGLRGEGPAQQSLLDAVVPAGGCVLSATSPPPHSSFRPPCGKHRPH